MEELQIINLKKKVSNRILSLLISFLYVVLGLIPSLLFWNGTNIPLPFDRILNALFPATFFTNVILFSERNPFGYILIEQIIVFLLAFALSYFILSIFRKTKI